MSLGLVGALSIVRFRAAIKEPEELVYLFIIIAIGLGYGANQFIITLCGFVIIVFILFILSKLINKESELKANDLDISISINKKLSEKEVRLIEKILKNSSNSVKLASTVFLDNETSLNFEVEIDKFDNLNKLRKNLQSKFQGINISSSERKYLSL